MLKFICKILGHKFHTTNIALYNKKEIEGYIFAKKEIATPIECKRCKRKFTISEYRKLKRS